MSVLCIHRATHIPDIAAASRRTPKQKIAPFGVRGLARTSLHTNNA